MKILLGFSTASTKHERPGHKTCTGFESGTKTRARQVIPYSGKLSREKTFMNFEVLWLFVKVFSAKFGGVTSFGGNSKALRESLLRENLTNSRKGVSPLEFMIVYHS